MAKLTGISRQQVYRAVDCGMVDTFVSKWIDGVPRTYIIVNDRLAFWLWAFTLPPVPLEMAASIRSSFRVGRDRLLFNPDATDALDEIWDAVR